jgi:glycosyltransferase involved in cell wall biosynthesis
LLTYLRRNPQVSFEIFGTIPVPHVLKEFGARITLAPKIDNYEQFLQRFVEYEWDIGICPLVPIPFNFLKANSKWVEYTAVGAAVVASRGTVYDKCCSEGCGILATTEQEWLEALEYLTHNPESRSEMVRHAQEKLRREYTPVQLRSQVWSMINLAQDGQISNAINLRTINNLKKIPKNERILFISNAYVPTLQLSFVKPLAGLVANEIINIDFLFENELKQEKWRDEGFSTHVSWIEHRFEKFRPTLLIFCRYSGPHSDLMLDLAKRRSIPCIYHIDDDLLSIPKDIGRKKFEFHNNPKRLESVRLLLDQSDMVYASTAKLAQHLTSLAIKSPIIAGLVYCSGKIINKAVYNPARKIGYMASADHAHNLTQVIGALVRLLRKYPSVSFEFFGSIASPPELIEFGERIRHAPKIDNYDEFLLRFAEYQWDIGICPLNPIHFNMMKSNTKWVEYTSVGAAVVATKGTVYDDCCSKGCGLLAETEDEWFDALDLLVSDSDARYHQIVQAQEKLVNEYSIETLREQVLNIVARAHALHEIVN